MIRNGEVRAGRGGELKKVFPIHWQRRINYAKGLNSIC